MSTEKQFKIPAGVELETIACPMGCPEGDDLVLVGRDRLHDLPGEFPVVRCQHCGLMRTNPRPTSETIGFYYPDDYGPYQGTQVTNSRWYSISQMLRKFVNVILPTHACLLPDLTAGRMLEVGCASGKFLHEMARKGWQVHGIEFSDSAAASARLLGYPVTTGQVESVADFEEPFDLVVGWMVIEHLHHPVEALTKLYNWTRSGGWLAISVPNAGSAEFRIFKENWYALHLPAHLSHFTPETMRKMLTAAGWSVERIQHQRTLTNLIMSANYWVAERFPDSFLSKMTGWIAKKQRYLNLALYPLSTLLSFFGQTGRMTVLARKPE